ncbi:MAG: LPS export ABC transporter periplasmic protein LptC [Candidatus Gastranaerophilales bacterium]|nr:LPS export ABC transporter periplasmic protein LptC [Candidatus Gastranaerophilales bacterium]
MSKKLKILLSILVAIIVLSTWAFLVSIKLTENVKRVPEEQPISDENAAVQDLVLTESKNGKKFWEIYATSGDYDNLSEQVHLKNVKGNFYKNDKVVLSFDSPVATYFDRKKEVKLSGGARAATDNNILISAKELYWKGNNEEIVAKGNVKIIRSSINLIVTGNESSFTPKMSQIKMKGLVNTTLFKISK